MISKGRINNFFSPAGKVFFSFLQGKLHQSQLQHKDTLSLTGVEQLKIFNNALI